MATPEATTTKTKGTTHTKAKERAKAIGDTNPTKLAKDGAKPKPGTGTNGSPTREEKGGEPNRVQPAGGGQNLKQREAQNCIPLRV